jgi:hypothetical protein
MSKKATLLSRQYVHSARLFHCGITLRVYPDADSICESGSGVGCSDDAPVSTDSAPTTINPNRRRQDARNWRTIARRLCGVSSHHRSRAQAPQRSGRPSSLRATRTLIAATLLLNACGAAPAAPTPPPPPPVPACQANNTADVSFGNRSTSATQDIFWDGLRVATITPGANSAPRTVAAGVAHRLEVRVTNTMLLACQASSPIPAVCATPIYTCAFP